ncbi:MAG: hypothetical protein WAM70_06815, partial [Pyrinomonadaceae bacterium]
MKADLIIGFISIVALGILFLRSKIARVVLIETLSHPLRTTVIKTTTVRDANKSKDGNRKMHTRVV